MKINRYYASFTFSHTLFFFCYSNNMTRVLSLIISTLLVIYFVEATPADAIDIKSLVRREEECEPTTIVSKGLETTIVVPGSTATAFLRNGGTTTVVVNDKTSTFIPDVKVVTDTETVITRTTVVTGGQHTVTHTVTGPAHASHVHGGKWDDIWNDIWTDKHNNKWHSKWDNKWDEDRIDHSKHHHEPDEECSEFDDNDTEIQ